MKSTTMRSLLIVWIVLCTVWTTQAFSSTATGCVVPRGTLLLHSSTPSGEDDSNTIDETAAVPPAAKPDVKCPDCDLCDGSGRILGGIAVLLPWWPIKAYRPCPNFIARGGLYERSGQGLDEIAFGRDSTFDK